MVAACTFTLRTCWKVQESIVRPPCVGYGYTSIVQFWVALAASLKLSSGLKKLIKMLTLILKPNIPPFPMFEALPQPDESYPLFPEGMGTFRFPMSHRKSYMSSRGSILRRFQWGQYWEIVSRDRYVKVYVEEVNDNLESSSMHPRTFVWRIAGRSLTFSVASGEPMYTFRGL